MSKSGVGVGRSVIAAIVAGLFLWQSPVSAQVPCVGDCDGDGAVRVNELIRGVNILLGNAALDTCPAFDSSGDGAVAVNELIQGVNAALQGCIAGPTATPAGSAATETPTMDTAPTETPTMDTAPTETPVGPTSTATATDEPTSTPTATQPQATDTPTPRVEEVAGASAAVANALSSIANVVGAVVAGASGGVGGGAALSGIPGGGAGGGTDPCELGGTVFSDIDISFPTGTVTVNFNMCAVSRPGGSVLFDGSLTVTNLNVLNFRGQGAFNATIQFRDAQGGLSAETVANIQSPLQLTLVAAQGDPCAIDTPLGDRAINSIGLTELTGTLTSNVPNQGQATVDFDSTSVQLDITDSGPDCVPTAFDMTFDGDSMIEQTAGSTQVGFDLTFVNFLLSAVQSGTESLVTMTGDLIASCFGGMVSISTPLNLSFLLGQFCPGSGVISIQDVGEIIYSQQGVGVGGMTFASCLDPALLTCVQ